MKRFVCCALLSSLVLFLGCIPPQNFTKLSQLVPMRDGTLIAVDAFIPTKCAGPCEGPFPVVWEYTPYRRASADPYIDFLFGELAGGERELSHEELKSGRRKLRRWFFDWKKKLVAAGRAEGIFEPEGRAARNRALLLAATLMALGVVFMFVADWAGLVPFFTGIVLLATAFLMIRRSPEAQEEALRWKAFARYLRRTGKMKASGAREDGRVKGGGWHHISI